MLKIGVNGRTFSARTVEFWYILGNLFVYHLPEITVAVLLLLMVVYTAFSVVASF